MTAKPEPALEDSEEKVLRCLSTTVTRLQTVEISDEQAMKWALRRIDATRLRLTLVRSTCRLSPT